ncbi:MAG: SDR family oxidoreductase [Hyphomicrobiales bacterium]|nr:SDR family oxidoreductase [Hyphomicrobiales bacterium]
MSALFCFGLGFSARALARRLLNNGWAATGTARSEDKLEALRGQGFGAVLFDGEAPGPEVPAALNAASHVVVSTPPGEAGDPVLRHHGDDLAAASSVGWIGYLSTVGVYGDHQGQWIDETAPLNPKSERSKRRVAAERAWLDFGARSGKPVQIFRLAGIYGPGRSAIDNLRQGRARRINKPGQVFNRIHVEDIATVLEASIARPNAGAIYNVTDDLPAPPQDVVAYGAELMGVPAPPEVSFEEADLSPMGRSFYGENKRVSNARIASELGVRLACPTYREGLKAVLDASGE